MTSAALGNANAKIALKMALFALGMLGLAFASVPLYRVFCQVTGFGGTTQVAATAPGAVAGEIGVRFDANVNGVPWRFKPKQTTVRIAPGARTQVAYEATSLVARPTSGTATFNVTPAIAGQYFSKIECFCFTEQTLEAGQSVDMPVIFFVDPAIKEDPDTAHIDEITLSYTFFPLEKQAASR